MPKARTAEPKGQFTLLRQEKLERLEALASNSVDCIWTDPPYLLSNNGISFQNGQITSVNKGAWDRSRGLSHDLSFHQNWVEHCYRVLKPGGTIWASGTHHAYLLFGYAMLQAGFRILNDIVWHKPNPPPNISKTRFVFASEVLLWAVKPSPNGKARHQFHHEVMARANRGHSMTSVWRMPAAGPQEKVLGRHPTQKPVALVERCLQASTTKGETILDPFMGSGTTGVAALRQRRKFIGIERDEDFLELARRRLEDVSSIGPPHADEATATSGSY